MMLYLQSSTRWICWDVCRCISTAMIGRHIAAFKRLQTSETHSIARSFRRGILRHRNSLRSRLDPGYRGQPRQQQSGPWGW